MVKAISTFPAKILTRTVFAVLNSHRNMAIEDCKHLTIGGNYNV